MLPPVENSVIQSNPDFALLYTTLTTAILNPDASTKKDAGAKERNSVRERLDKHRLVSAKHHLLTHAIMTLDPAPADSAKQSLPQPTVGTRRVKPPQPQLRHNRGSSSSPSFSSVEQLPPAVVELLLLLPPFLSTAPSDLELSPSSTALLLSQPPFSQLPALLPTLSALVSSHLHASAVHLARISNPSTNPSFIHRSVPTLPTYAADLAAAVQTRQTALSKARLATAASSLAADLLVETAVALSRLVRSLEAKHGPIARSLEFRAAEMALSAQRQEHEVQTALWLTRRDTYSPDVVRALGSYAAHLRDAKARLREGIRNARMELAGYGVDVDGDGDGDGDGDVERNTSRLVRRERGGKIAPSRDKEKDGKERTMREMARVYREMGRQVQEVRGDLERLGRA